ncbi:zinc ribbon domain-containing protein [Ammoniphilus resinae]|uniref:Membrane protein YvbJ n=1 Tax=Ammoniphilus resinae TaxID=861532 RepID=A0ABS4GIR6_9BACL|nr:hypothetical protein [Ammoniphilus resinae]MBP1930153.1 putative membrane protein YvbJ [Ammoniphilus resinae]
MNFCKECGTKLQENYLHCPECGMALHSTANSENKESHAPISTQPIEQPVTVSPKQPMGKKQKRTLITLALLLIIAAGLYQVGASLTDKDRVIKQFEEAIIKGDSEKVANLLSSEDKRLTIDGESIESFIKYFKDNPSSLNQTINILKEQSEQFDQEKENKIKAAVTNLFGSNNDTTFIALEKDGKKFLLYDNYDLRVKPYFLSVETNYPNTKIYLNDKEVAVSDQENFETELGPFLPGVYKIKAVHEGQFTTLQNEQDLELFSNDDFNYVDLYLEGQYTNVDVNFKDAKLLVNGKDTGLISGDGQSLGPVTFDGSNKIVAEKQFPWGPASSEEMPITEGYLSLIINPATDSVKEDIMKSTNEFVQGWIESFNALDASKAQSISAEKRQLLEDYITKMKENQSKYKGVKKSITFDLDSFSIWETRDGNYYAELIAQEEFSEVVYSAEETNPVPEDKVSTMAYTLMYKDGKWMVTDWRDGYSLGSQNVKEFTN